MTHPARFVAFLFVFTLVSLFTLGCGSWTESKTLADFDNALKANGISYSEKFPKFAMLIKAVDGASYSINGCGIQVYQFDFSDPVSKSWHNTIAKDGLDGSQFLANRNLLIWGDRDHPDWDKILKVFNSL